MQESLLMWLLWKGWFHHEKKSETQWWSCGAVSRPGIHRKTVWTLQSFLVQLAHDLQTYLPPSATEGCFALVLMQLLVGHGHVLMIIILYIILYNYILHRERERLYKIPWIFAMSGQHNPHHQNHQAWRQASNCASVQIAMVASSSTTSNTKGTNLTFECVKC